MVAPEAAPFAKTGGLADVVGALPGALAELGHQVAVVLPRYGTIDRKSAQRIFDNLDIWLGPARHRTSIYSTGEKVRFYFVDCPPLYDRPGLYGDAAGDFPDNHIRFAVLARAAIYQKNFTAGFINEIHFSEHWQNTTAVYGAYTDFTNPGIRVYELRQEPHFGGRTVFQYKTQMGSSSLQLNAGGEAQKGFYL